MKKTMAWSVLLCLLGGGGWYGWKSREATPAQTAWKPAEYRATPVTGADVASAISADGTIVPQDVVDVGAQVNGQILSFGVGTDGRQVDYGSTVAANALLARIDDSLYAEDVATGEAQVAQAKALVQVAQASLAQAQAVVQQTERDWARAQRLGGSKAISQSDYDAAESAFEQAKAGVDVARASIVQAQASVKSAEAALLRSRSILAYCTVRSPVGGVVIDRRVDIGDTVVSSLSAPSLFLIAKNLSRMQVLVQVNEADIGHVLPGQPITFTTQAFPGEIFTGEVRKIRLNATMAQNVVTYTVEIVAENEAMKLLPYLTANVRFVMDAPENVSARPNAAREKGS